MSKLSEYHIKYSSWEIDCDSYYPYCKNCRYEPDKKETVEKGLPCICPSCKSIMTNTDRLSKNLED